LELELLNQCTRISLEIGRYLSTKSKDELSREISAMAESAGERFSISCVGIDGMTDERQVRRFIQVVQGLK